MSIHKCKRKIALCIASIFWAACDNDSSSAPDVTLPLESSDIPGSSVTPTSSETAPAESSSSSSPEYPYILAIHPSVHCKDSTFFQKATCKNTAAKVSSEIQSEKPLYGVPCLTEDTNSPIFKCEDGSMFPNAENSSSLVGDTIVQFTKYCGELMRTDECIAKMAEEAEAKPESPYKLARDTTINCKESFKPILSELAPILTGFQSEYLTPEGCFKCDDGNVYDWDDMLHDEKGNLWEKANP